MTEAFAIDDAVCALRTTPATLRAWLAALPNAWLDANEGAGTWSPRDVVAHLTDLEQTDWMTSAQIILRDGTSTVFPPIERERFRETFAQHSISELLDEFAVRRARNLDLLLGLHLAESDLDRRGVHPAFGEVTMRQLLATWVVHDQTHIAQIARTMAGRYRDAVGPWVEYLSVLKRNRAGVVSRPGA